MEHMIDPLLAAFVVILAFIIGWFSAKGSVLRAVRKAHKEPHSMQTLERIGFLSGLQRVLELI